MDSSVSHPNHRAEAKRDDRRRRADVERRQNRNEIMMDLDKLKVRFDGDEPTWELEHLLQRVTANNQVNSSVAFMKLGLKGLSLAVELGAQRFYPGLRLSGWSESLSRDLDTGNSDYLLEQVYRKFFRKGPPNVFFSFALLILGSAFFHSLGAPGAAQKGKGGPLTGFQSIMSSVAGMFGVSGGGAGGASEAARPVFSSRTAAGRSKDTSPARVSTSAGGLSAVHDDGEQPPRRRNRIAPAS